MSEIVYCKCGFKCVAEQLHKSEGRCPKCKEKHPSMKEDYP